MCAFSRLKGKMSEMNFSQESLAQELGITRISLGSKLRGTTQFKYNEIKVILELFEMKFEDLF